MSLLFVCLLSAGAVSDVRYRRVPNVLVIALLSLSIVAAFFDVSLATSVAASLAGAALGLALWIPFWLLGLLGAGDVKFFSCGAAWIGPALCWRAALLSALIGGCMCVVLLIRRAGARSASRDVVFQLANARELIASADLSSSDAAVRTFPYALPMALSIAVSAFFPEWVFSVLGL